MCWGIFGEVLPNAVHVSLSCSAGSALEVATLARCKMASTSQETQDTTCVEVCVCVRECGGGRKCIQSFTFQCCSSSELSLHSAYAFRCHGTLCALVNVCVCLYANIRTCICMSFCVLAGHPEASRPDVQESGLCGVMSGCLADTADLEQCTQVSPSNELSI